MPLGEHLMSTYSVSCTRHWTPKRKEMDRKFEKWALPFESTAVYTCAGSDNFKQIT